jgi:aryl-alcohol dehydrogenase-like predicted oxidoreductase
MPDFQGVDVQLPRLGLGTNQFGSRVGVAEASEILAVAIAGGMTLVDTAELYGAGASESVIGEALGKRRPEVLLLTKFMPKNDPRRSCEESLKRLRTDHLDIFLLHFPLPDHSVEPTLEAMGRLMEEGKVRAIGCSNFAGWEIANVDWTARSRGLPRFQFAQNRYSLLEREVEGDVVPACQHFGLGLLCYYPLGAGLLTGKYHRGEPPPEGARLATTSPTSKHFLRDSMFDRLEALERFAAERRVSLLSLAVGGLLAQPGVSTVVLGATKASQVAANLEAATWTPTSEDLAALAELR